jgi:hypothetical protein
MVRPRRADHTSSADEKLPLLLERFPSYSLYSNVARLHIFSVQLYMHCYFTFEYNILLLSLTSSCIALYNTTPIIPPITTHRHRLVRTPLASLEYYANAWKCPFKFSLTIRQTAYYYTTSDGYFLALMMLLRWAACGVLPSMNAVAQNPSFCL